MNHDQINAALTNERLIVKVGRSWWLAQKTGEVVNGDDWIIQVRAGPHNRRGIITNIDGNRAGREFRVL